ncbi:MAG: amidase, partial [Actinomycetota bacterium]
GTDLALTKSVRDTAAIFDALNGSTPFDLYTAPPPARPYIEEVGRDPGRLRVGFVASVDHPSVEIHPEAARAVLDAAKLMESLGHVVVEGGPDLLFDEKFLHHAEIDYASRILATFEALWRFIGREPSPDDVEPYTWARMERVGSVTAQQLLRSDAWLHAWVARTLSWWSEFDLLLTPATGEPPATLEELEVDPRDPFEIDLRRFARIRCFVRPFNVTGQPAISLPLHLTGDGLPLGVQLVSALYREDLLIRVAAQLEQAAPWGERGPPV